uniref:Uncharacterized protein n=2 Tax=Lygus hesperus TaxID=30085 RepID=A0A0K8S6G4_LYGHE
MTDHLFPESTTYVHSYQPHEILTPREQHVSAEASIVEYLQPTLAKKSPQHPEPTKQQVENGFEPPKETFLKKSDGSVHTTTIGNVDIGDLTAEDKAFFISKTYKTTYDDYAKTVPTGQSGLKQPFGRLDDQMLLVLNANKPDLAHYGFGLPNKCCVAWGTAQSRTLPSEDREHVVEKRRVSDHIGRAGYPEKMYPYISKGELSPHYDGSFVFGYTGHQRHPDIHDYPEDIDAILRRDFPMHVPRNLTTNQANLIHKPIPQCEKEGQIIHR